MLSVRHLGLGDPDYPSALHSCRGGAAPLPVAVAGTVDILRKETLAMFCSARCPGSLILRAHDLAQALRQSDLAVCGGFHSPVERECFTVLLRGPAPVIVCPARSLSSMRLPAAYKQPLAEGRMLLLSPFADTLRRPDTDNAVRRNEFAVALAGSTVIAYAAPGSKTEQLARYVLALGKPLLTFESPHNENLVSMGARIADLRSPTGRPPRPRANICCRR